MKKAKFCQLLPRTTFPVICCCDTRSHGSMLTPCPVSPSLATILMAPQSKSASTVVSGLVSSLIFLASAPIPLMVHRSRSGHRALCAKRTSSIRVISTSSIRRWPQSEQSRRSDSCVTLSASVSPRRRSPCGLAWSALRMMGYYYSYTTRVAPTILSFTIPSRGRLILPDRDSIVPFSPREGSGLSVLAPWGRRLPHRWRAPALVGSSLSTATFFIRVTWNATTPIGGMSVDTSRRSWPIVCGLSIPASRPFPGRLRLAHRCRPRKPAMSMLLLRLAIFSSMPRPIPTSSTILPLLQCAATKRSCGVQCTQVPSVGRLHGLGRARTLRPTTSVKS